MTTPLLLLALGLSVTVGMISGEANGMTNEAGVQDGKDNMDFVVMEHAFQVAEEPEHPFMAPVWVTLGWQGNDGGEGTLHVPAFYDGDSVWRMRHTPLEPGRYIVRNYLLGDDPDAAALLDAKPLSTSGSEFTVENSPVRVFPTPCREHVQRFRYNTGEPYFPIGYNVGWSTLDGYRDHFSRMEKTGLNWSRVWMCHWSDQNPDWVMGRHLEPGDLDLDVLRRWDEIIRLAEKHGVLLQLVLQHHGQYSTWVNPNWEENPWNRRNGGWLDAPSDFFTDEKARKLTRARYRYFVARWGYSPAILAWELFNEVEFTNGYLGEPLVALWPQAGSDSSLNATTFTRLGEVAGAFRTIKTGSGPGNLERLLHAWKNMSTRRPVLYDFGLGRDQVADWHDEMAAYIRNLDPTPRMVTTSSIPPDSRIWDSMDFKQVHTYQRQMITPMLNLPGDISNHTKPVFVGEMGDHEVLDNHKTDGRYYHGMIWAGLFSGAAGAAQVWAWDQVVQQDMYPIFRSVIGFIDMAEIAFHPFQPINLMAAGHPNGREDMVVNAHGLLADGRLLMWIHDGVMVNQNNPSGQHASIQLPDGIFEESPLKVTWWNTRKGAVEEVAIHEPGPGSPLTTPEFEGDIAAIVVPDHQYTRRSLP